MTDIIIFTFRFSMAAGDFLEVYSDEKYLDSQDCVVTCFFMDCAHNIVDFIELIYKVLLRTFHLTLRNTTAMKTNADMCIRLYM